MWPSDTLVVTGIDCLGRSAREIIATILDLAERDINVRVLEPALDVVCPRHTRCTFPRVCGRFRNHLQPIIVL